MSKAESIGKCRHNEIDMIFEIVICIPSQRYRKNAGNGSDDAHVIDMLL